ncbi:MAG: hypothetical protein QXO86_06955 [Nitrososphaerota archaeon]
MTSYILCIPESLSLSERRSIIVWDAITELVGELLPERRGLLSRWNEKHVASREESAAWLEACFRVRDYKPRVPVDLSQFYTPFGYDIEKAAKALKIKQRQAAMMFRKLEKALMLAVCNEVAYAVKHSWENQHTIVLTE